MEPAEGPNASLASCVFHNLRGDEVQLEIESRREKWGELQTCSPMIAPSQVDGSAEQDLTLFSASLTVYAPTRWIWRIKGMRADIGLTKDIRGEFEGDQKRE